MRDETGIILVILIAVLIMLGVVGWGLDRRLDRLEEMDRRVCRWLEHGNTAEACSDKYDSRFYPADQR